MKKAIGSIAVLATVALLSGCGPASTTATADSPVPSASSATTPVPTPAKSTPKTIAAPIPIPVVRPRPIATRRTGAIKINAAGAVLPNSARTPGAINPSVTQANIGRTICVPGWTATVRPVSNLTTGIKEAQLASGYAYNGDTAKSDYEEDHLISLELGGAPSAEANLWPEPYNAPEGARVKDLVENKLHSLICSGTITLATAQRAIARNWWIAYQTYVGSAPASSAHKAPAVAQPAAAAAHAPRPAPAPVASGSGATALCKDGSYSFAVHHQGACSHHGGVKVFYK